MIELFSKKPTRIFTFGCSFTDYIWPTWANIIAYDLNIPFHNYGRGGAGNQFIFNTIMQADTYHNFNENDLIMVCWSSLSREDRISKGKWITPGGIYTQNHIYDRKYVKKWADTFNYAVRDFASIKATWELLNSRGCQFHFMKILDFCSPGEFAVYEDPEIPNLLNFYDFYLNKIERSFFDILWDNNFYKMIEEGYLVNPSYCITHPLPVEHLFYLENIFDYEFKEDTKNKVNKVNDFIIETVKKFGHPEDYITDDDFLKKSDPIFMFGKL